MKFQFRNLGIINRAELTLGDFTIVCGKNNTCKTYVTYAMYGAFYLWHILELEHKPFNRIVDELIENETAILPLDGIQHDRETILRHASKYLSGAEVGKVISGIEKSFEKTDVILGLDDVSEQPTDEDIKKVFSDNEMLEGKRIKGTNSIRLSLTRKARMGKENTEQVQGLRLLLMRMMIDVLFINQISRPFIASTERTGAAIFQKELDFTRARLVDVLKGRPKATVDRLLGKFSGDYPIPVRNNVDFIRELSSIAKKNSVLVSEHPDVLKQFENIIGGEYRITEEGEVLYAPQGGRVNLTMVESSSAVRSLLDIGFYLKHVARPGDILMIDEPELNLHPENQRLVTRLLATIVNCGIKVFITTHSDYVIREINTLMALHEPGDERLVKLAKKEKYQDSEILSREKVQLYTTQEEPNNNHGQKAGRQKGYILVKTEIDQETGISLGSFDDTITEMNRIQDEIVWGQ